MFQTEPAVSDLASPPTLVWIYRIARSAHGQRTPGALLESGLLFLSLVQQRRQLGGWFGEDAHLLQAMLVQRPSLATVVRRPYISTGWSAARRVLGVAEHYRLLGARASALRVGADEKIGLATVASRESTVAVVLDSPAWFVHEGELALNLFHGDDRIYTIAFSLGFDRGEPVAYVGALQGFGNEHALALYRTLTHDFHGLRPRDLLIAAFRTMCREVGVQRWLAVGNDFRVSCSPYFQRENGVNADYDEVWSEHGSTRRADGFHLLSAETKRRTQEQIPARKRSAYRRRYELLDQLDADLARALQSRRHATAAEGPDRDGRGPVARSVARAT